MMRQCFFFFFFLLFDAARQSNQFWANTQLGCRPNSLQSYAVWPRRDIPDTIDKQQRTISECVDKQVVLGFTVYVLSHKHFNH